MKKLLILLIAAAVMIPGYTQDKKNEAPVSEKNTEKTETAIFDTKAYTEVVLEDFEETQYSKKNIKYLVSRNQDGDVSIRDEFPAQNGRSKKYLGVKYFGRDGDTLIIYPAKELTIDKYCREIAVWVYGKKFSGELSLMLQDATLKNHRLVLGKLNFLGWRKLVIRLGREIKQEDDLLSQKKFMKILHFQYRPGNKTRMPIWHYFYLDDITAMVREKYTDRQSDDW
ncbi:MAG TPA: flagellar filament outer layer protein FlaA [Spirochaetota bacterium]|nr:flagellar filament outer layer protein FlaA [Spirochaetota bacterium]HPI89205.1 flagellar filament outer layer protein FlaA [Spirochaetota bacterium]HPR48978.1 flagellar filament outer layer protein FlaA [Spirochaetota bacterium]